MRNPLGGAVVRSVLASVQSSTFALIAILGGGLVACADGLGFEPIVTCSDSQAVTLRVEAGVTPRFTWQPACGMASLQVFPDTGITGAWVLYSGTYAAENPLPSGIRYGQVPPKGIAPSAPRPLVHGLSYHVTVYRWIGQPGGPGSLFERGSAAFTP